MKDGESIWFPQTLKARIEFHTTMLNEFKKALDYYQKLVDKEQKSIDGFQKELNAKFKIQGKIHD